jgi:transcriptional regulator with XRE-family HTH domain
MGYPRPKPKHLATKLLQIRERLKLSQAQLAFKFDILSASRIAEYESGRREPNLMVLLSYAKSVGISVDTLIDDSVKLTL